MELCGLRREMTRNLRIEPALDLRTQLKNFDDSHGSRPFDQATRRSVSRRADVTSRPESRPLVGITSNSFLAYRDDRFQYLSVNIL
jgi:hypothetical protein